MATTIANSGSQLATQQGWQQLKLQQAQRNAAAAEQTARALEAQASQAKQEADRAQEGARNLEVQSSQARDNAGRAQQGVAAIKTANQMTAQLGIRVDRATQLQSQTTKEATPVTSSAPPSTSSPSSTSVASPVVNTKGETTGRIVNTTA